MARIKNTGKVEARLISTVLSPGEEIEVADGYLDDWLRMEGVVVATTETRKAGKAKDRADEGDDGK